MITINPVGLSSTLAASGEKITSDKLRIEVELTEKFCGTGRGSSISPQTALFYTPGTPTIVGSTLFIPITATMTIITPRNNRAITQVFSEEFTVAFQNRDTVPGKVIIESEGHLEGVKGKCKYSYNDSLLIILD